MVYQSVGLMECAHRAAALGNRDTAMANEFLEMLSYSDRPIELYS